MSQQMSQEQMSQMKQTQRQTQAKTRKRLRELQEELQNNHKYRDSEEGNNHLIELHKTQNETYEKVTENREAAIDGELFDQTTGLMKTTANKSLNNTRPMVEWNQFSKKLIAVFGDGDRGIDWMKLGNQALTLLKRTPTAQFMFGPLDAGPEAKKPLKDRKRLKKGPVVESQVDDLARDLKESDRPDNAHEAQIADIQDSLVKRSKETGQPTDLFHFALNPDSFSQTVENLFGVSFLLKEGYAEHVIADGKQRLVSRKIKDSASTEPDPERKQCVLKLDYEAFEKLRGEYQGMDQILADREKH